MRKTRLFIEGAVYHVTSRTNNKIRAFESGFERHIMSLVLREAEKHFGFRLCNFCIMPTHIHLLIEPGAGGNLPEIMHWIKFRSARQWNQLHGSIGHLWGERYFARVIEDDDDYSMVMDYIDKNPVKAGLVPAPEDWKDSGAGRSRQLAGT